MCWVLRKRWSGTAVCGPIVSGCVHNASQLSQIYTSVARLDGRSEDYIVPIAARAIQRCASMSPTPITPMPTRDSRMSAPFSLHVYD